MISFLPMNLRSALALPSTSFPASHAAPAEPPGRIDVRAIPRVLSRLTRLALRYPALCALAMACALGAAAFNLLTPMLLGRAVDSAHGLRVVAGSANGAALDALWWTGLSLIGACAARGIVTGAQGYIGEMIANRVGYDLRMAFFDKLQHLSFSFHDRRHSGDLIARGMLDLEGVRGFLEMGMLRVVTLVFLVGAGAWRLLHVDVTMGVLALSFVPFVVWRAAGMGVMLRLTWQRLQQLMADLTRGMEENLQGVRVVRAFGSQAHELDRFDAASQTALALSMRRITIRMRAMSGMNFAYYLAMAAVLWLGGRRVADGTLTVGLLTECLTFMTLLQLPVRQVGMIVNASARAASSGARLFEVLDAEPEIRDARDAKPLVLRDKVMRFENVSFGYAAGQAVLHDVSFELRAGRLLGVVGAPGSGKSTVAQLMPRFYDVNAGRITIDGQDLREVALESLRAAVTLVQQEAFLFDATVHDNGAYARPPASRDEVVDAATVAQLHEQVGDMRKGYDTRVGERGVGLSGGQRQRLSITRGLVAAPAILVLDDAMSAVDATTERHLRHALREAAAGQAVMVIANRLSAVVHADEILVFEAGRIAERGTHMSLLALGGRYAALWALQTDERHGHIEEQLLEAGLAETGGAR
jgi:ATP-binding cassette subfamily B multidrug efflux pump